MSRVYTSVDPMIRLRDRITVDPATNCWNVSGPTSPKTYPMIDTRERPSEKKVTAAHIVIYERIRGPIPEGHVVHHVCHNRHCANPWHLETKTIGPHLHDHALSRTRCRRGHDYTPENTGVHKSTGYRYCRACYRMKHREGYHRRKGNTPA